MAYKYGPESQAANSQDETSEGEPRTEPFVQLKYLPVISSPLLILPALPNCLFINV